MLTEKQYNLLMFINKVNRETGQCPSFDEMKDAIGLKSKSGIHALITSLEERNFIRRLPHKARAMEVVRLPRFKPQAIIDDIKTGIEKTDGEYVDIIDRKEAIRYAIMNAQEGDVIILAGKGHEDYQ